MRTVVIAAGAMLVIAVLAGCGGAADETGTTDSVTSSTTGSSTSESPSESAPAPPGLYDLSGGAKQALGVLAHLDLEGGFWAIVKAFEGEPTEGAQVVAVLANAEDLGVDLEALKGRYVSAEGKLLEGASIRMAGPEMEVTKLTAVEETTVNGESQDEPGY